MLASLPAFEARSRGGALNNSRRIYVIKGNRWIATGISLKPAVRRLTRCSLLNYFAQPDKLICALIWLHVTPTFKIMHRRGADRA